MALDLNKTEHYFGNKQKMVSTFFFLLFNVAFYGVIFLFAYAVITFNYHMIIAIALLPILQLPIRKCDAYVRFLKKYINPFKYFKNVQIVYDHGVPNT